LIDNTKFRASPTVFFVKENDVLKQVVMVETKNRLPKNRGKIRVEMFNKSFEINLNSVSFYSGKYIIGVPEVSQLTRAKFTLTIPGKKKYSCSIIINPCKHWKIYMTPHTHLDVGFTQDLGFQDKVWEFHARNLDKVISLCKETKDYPEESRFKWTCEVSRLIKNYIEKRPARKIRELVELIKEGRIEVAGLYLNEPTELVGHEELVRLVYYSNKLRKKWGINIKSAMIDDVPGYTWALPQILSKAGIKYLSLRANRHRAGPLWKKIGRSGSVAEIPEWEGISRPFFWKSPNGDKILTWYTDSYREGNFFRFVSGLKFTFEDIISDIIKKNKKVGYPYDVLQLRMGGDNIDAILAPCENAKEWNKRWAYPKIIIATNSEFFKYLEDKYENRFPIFSGDIPSWWADGAASSARETGVNRITHDELTSAEKFSTFGFFLNSSNKYPANDIDKAYDDMMLYDEHTWGSSGSISKPYDLKTLGQWAIKSSFSYKAAIRTKDILKNALSNIAYEIKIPSEGAIAVFNSLSWERSDIVHLNVPINYLKGNKYFQIIDVQSGENLPYQIIGKQEKSLIIGFFAQNVPPLGYKIYKILPSDKLPKFKNNNIYIDDERIENKFYKILIDQTTGGISSILDKELNREIVDQNSPYKVNQYIYERVKGGRKAIYDMEKGAKFYRSSPTYSNLTSEMKGPVMGSIRINTSGEVCPKIMQEVILYEDIKRIDIINILTKEETLETEGVYYAFPFKVEKPSFKCEIADAIFSPGANQLNGSATDYYSIQHWLDISNHNYGITWATIEAPLVQLCDINTGKWLKRLEIPNSTFFSYIMNNYWDTNFKASQGGNLTFRYSITTHRENCDVVKATHFGWNYANPLVGVFLSKSKEGLLPAKFSFCQVDRPNVNLLVIKLAEDRRGYIVRLQEIKGKETFVEIIFPYFKNLKAYLTNIVEEDIERLKTHENVVIVPLQPFSITTVRVIV